LGSLALYLDDALVYADDIICFSAVCGENQTIRCVAAIDRFDALAGEFLAQPCLTFA